MERTTPITISDEEQPEEGTTKDTDGPRPTEVGEEHTVETEGEKITNMEEAEKQSPMEAGEKTEAVVVVDHSVNTEDEGDLGAEAEQPQQLVPDRAEEPGQQHQPEPTRVKELEQPPQSELDKATESEQ